MIRFIKQMVIISLLITCVTSVSQFSQTEQAVAQTSVIMKLTIDHRLINTAVPPQTISGNTVVPMRTLFEALGAKVQWNANGGTILATRGVTNIALRLNQVTATVNGKTTRLNVAPTTIRGTTMVPLRFVAESLNAEVRFNANLRLVEVFSQRLPIVTIEMQDGQKIILELYPKLAPNTVNNFISLVKKGFYNGVVFHRIIPGFVIQGGDPLGQGVGGPGYTIKGEFNANGIKNSLAHTRGVISMARSSAYDSAGSQFFIMVGDAQFLNGLYAAFGKVRSGMKVADAIVRQPVLPNTDRPVTPPAMKKVTVETYGVEYPTPQKVNP